MEREGGRGGRRGERRRENKRDISQKLYLQIPSYWGLGLQHRGFWGGTYMQFITNSQKLGGLAPWSSNSVSEKGTLLSWCRNLWAWRRGTTELGPLGRGWWWLVLVSLWGCNETSSASAGKTVNCKQIQPLLLEWVIAAGAKEIGRNIKQTEVNRKEQSPLPPPALQSPSSVLCWLNTKGSSWQSTKLICRFPASASQSWVKKGSFASRVIV